MKVLLFLTIQSHVFFLVTSEGKVSESLISLDRALEPVDCPGTCSSSIISCKTSGGKIVGVCSDGKICCRGGGTGGYGPTSPSVVTCGASVMAHKSVSFRSPNYPAFSGGSMVCEFTLQLNPATVGIRVDFIDLQLPSVPTNPVNFYESPHPVCDSDFVMFRGFSGWSPDFRCGNLTGYSFLIEREADQPTLSTILIMASPSYRWNMKYTEVYYNEVESLDYVLRSVNPNNNGENSQEKKQWTWYPPNMGMGGSSLSYNPMNIPALPPSMLAPPSWQYMYTLTHRSAGQFEGEAGYLNRTDSFSANSTEVEQEPENENHLSRIVGGIDAIPNSVPWQVSLQLMGKLESNICGDIRNLSAHFCGGSIIGENTILTASHCLFSSSRYSHPLLPAHDVKVVVGEHDLCTDNEVSSTREYSIERIIMHYNYLASDVINDLAIIQLKKPIKFDKNVHPITLANDHTKIEGLKPFLSGWGSMGVEENSTYPSVLQQTSNIHIFTERECQYFQKEFLEYVVPQYRLSGKYKAAFNHGICTKPTDSLTEAGFGDSGGGLVGLPHDKQGSPVLLGVVSHMRPHPDPETLKEFHLNYFGKVSAYRKWILMGMIH